MSENALDRLITHLDTLWTEGTLMSGAKRRKCGAKKRNGEPCQAPPMPNGRCRIHGGKSKAGGFGHPRYKHGKYSKSPLEAIAHRAAVEQRKRARQKKREIRQMSTAELKARARRLFKQYADNIDPEELRRSLLALYDAEIAATKAETPLAI